MKKFYAGSAGLYTLILCLLFAGCSKEETPEPEPEPVTGTALEVTVVDETGNALEGAVVDVYLSEEAWVSEDPAELVSSGATDGQGKLMLTDVEARKYYFSITQGTGTIRTNWEGVISTEQALEADKINTVNVVVQESVFGYLAGAGKNWMLEKVYMGSEDMTSQMGDCTMDDFLSFRKDFVYIYNQGETKCNSSATQEEAGTFEVNGNSVTTVDADGNEITMEVLSIDSNNFEASGGDLHPDVRMVYVATYE